MSQQNKTTLQSAINTQLADNTSGDISAADVRDNLINMTDSLLFNTGSAQVLTGSLTVTEGITGSLQGTATSASYISPTFISASAAASGFGSGGGNSATTGSNNFVGTQTVSGSVLVTGSLIVSGSNTFINVGPAVFSGSIVSTGGFTGSLQGTASRATIASTASYVAGGNVNGAVALATDAVNSALVYTIQTDTNGEYKVLFTDNLNLDDNSDVYKENGSTFTYNPGLNRLSLSRILADNITGSLQGTATAAVSASYAATASVLLGSVTSASYAVTASLSNTTLGAGDVGNVAGGEVQFRGNTTSLGGKNTFSSAFIWDTAYNGLLIADPNTTYTQNGGYYYLQVGTDVISAGNYAVSFGSSSYAQGEGTFTHGQEVTATAAYSHAEGYSTVTLGQFSHAEGYDTTATGNNSHAEGGSTSAVGLSSHAEGILTISQGSYSHAEGQSTTALGQASHAEGLGTVASGSFQHVQGRYNTPGDNTSLMIVGNGTFDTPSDAFKVRQSGSIVLPTTQSAAPSWTGTDGEIVPATVGGEYFLYMWMNGAWRSGSFV